MFSRGMKTRAAADRVTPAINTLNFAVIREANIYKTFVPVEDEPQIRIPHEGPLGKTSVAFFQINQVEEDIIYLMKSLFYLAANSDNTSVSEDFTMYINLLRMSFPGMDREIKKSLTDSSLTIVDFNVEDTVEWIRRIKGDLYTEQEFVDLVISPEECRVLVSIYWNFITKKLTAANVDKWYKKRVSAYATSLFASDEDECFTTLRPNITFASHINSAISAAFPFKRQVFQIIRSISEVDDHVMAGPAKITMIYFHMSELTNFAMIYEWIILKNPILLCWNGLAKHIPTLTTAVETFSKMGDDAPYCKFLYPSDQLEMFQHVKLQVFSAVAYEICITEGKSSFKNYRGVTSSDMSAELASKCKRLVLLWGGADTKSTHQMKSDLLYDVNEKNDLSKELTSTIDVEVEDNFEDLTVN